MLGVAITLSPIDPIKALYWTAVINGVVAVPVMTVMMLMTAQPRIMGKFTISGWLRALGWASTLAMAAGTIALGRDEGAYEEQLSTPPPATPPGPGPVDHAASGSE